MVGIDWLEKEENMDRGKRFILRHGRHFRRKNFIGDGKPNYCHTNAVKFVEENGGKLYYGLAYTPDVEIIGHSWPVVNGVPQEVTKNCDAIYLYIGVPVKDKLVDDKKYVDLPVKEIIDWDVGTPITEKLGVF